jgi:hypothetical protein
MPAVKVHVVDLDVCRLACGEGQRGCVLVRFAAHVTGSAAPTWCTNHIFQKSKQGPQPLYVYDWFLTRQVRARIP